MPSLEMALATADPTADPTAFYADPELLVIYQMELPKLCMGSARAGVDGEQVQVHL